MRRGQPHEVAFPQAGVVCHHFIRSLTSGYLCLPMVVRGDTLGLIQLEMPVVSNEDALRWRQLVVSVGEGIKLSLANLKMREIMSVQATHDSLTGLFNRRYMGDTLPRELCQARRQYRSEKLPWWI